MQELQKYDTKPAPLTISATVPNPWGEAVTLDESSMIQISQSQLPAEDLKLFDSRNNTAVYELFHDQIGPYARLTINGQSQDFRYLPPGQFLMGAPADEPERNEAEGPQHLVTLTQGLWLADTTCTQALWQALMGDNPSSFASEQLPVETVNWDNVQLFLGKLQACLPAGIEAVLPTEAEWEYACRAGTSTIFSFGDNISTAQVNYYGSCSYNNAPPGECRDKTIAVKALPANDWGFYQMHGNVWELCADTMCRYPATPVANPRGASGPDVESFAVRGGSWLEPAHCARSSRRDQWPRGYRYQDLGFRFALRHMSRVGDGGVSI